ncbi:Proteasome endopeptidase complex [Fasciolopsis buskii]|uniref:Proteasome subunit alpha type n=1 Tax=Fasciolopsis buskii TaxID=27845 RepID=A0A8E0RK04_9TREM|nr:Proteasome endopeptidase complex [Fasciolopsis buski]
MFLTRTEYDRGVNTFSPEGRLFQVEYAIEATKVSFLPPNDTLQLGSTGIGIKTPEGIVLAVEKRVNSPLIVPASIEKIFEVDDHIACAVSGLVADARTLIERARTEAAHHWFIYNEKMSVENVTKAVSNLALAFGDDDVDSGVMSRPFGAALLFAGIDENGPQLIHMDPSGTYIRYDAKAIGSGSEGAQQALQEVFHKNMTLREGCKHALAILKQVMEEKLDSTNVEMATVGINKQFHLFNKDEVQQIIQELGQS